MLEHALPLENVSEQLQAEEESIGEKMAKHMIRNVSTGKKNESINVKASALKSGQCRPLMPRSFTLTSPSSNWSAPGLSKKIKNTSVKIASGPFQTVTSGCSRKPNIAFDEHTFLHAANCKNSPCSSWFRRPLLSPAISAHTQTQNSKNV